MFKSLESPFLRFSPYATRWVTHLGHGTQALGCWNSFAGIHFNSSTTHSSPRTCSFRRPDRQPVATAETCFLRPFLQSDTGGCWRTMGRRKRAREEEEQEQDFESRSLYEVLGVDRHASHEEIRRAYYKSALRLHPDKNPGDENAKEKFQQLQNVMAVLGDPEKRELYDQTGSVDIDGEAVKSLYKFLRALFKTVTEEDIDVFSASYRGSKEEEKDLVSLYTKFKGDFKRVFTQMMCSDPQLDSHRFMDTIDAAISSGQVKEYKTYRRWASEVSKTARHPNPLATPKKKKNTSELTALINHRGKKQMDSLATTLEAKYGNKGSKKKSSKPIMEEPSEEEFLAAQKRVMKPSQEETLPAQKRVKKKSKR